MCIQYIVHHYCGYVNNVTFAANNIRTCESPDKRCSNNRGYSVCMYKVYMYVHCTYMYMYMHIIHAIIILNWMCDEKSITYVQSM